MKGHYCGLEQVPQRSKAQVKTQRWMEGISVTSQKREMKDFEKVTLVVSNVEI
jgi:hypothetical protein